MENDNLYRNLVILLKIFKNRPNHLAKYLIDNTAFTDNFSENLTKSDKLNTFDAKDTESYFTEPINLDTPYFSNYDQMKDYYNDMIIQEMKHLKNYSEIEDELNNKLSRYLFEENYEDASKLRDYMKRNNIIINIKKNIDDDISNKNK